MNELTDRIDALEKRVAELKDWKGKYESEKGAWEKERKELKKAAELTEALRAALVKLLPAAPAYSAGQKAALNVNLEEIQLNVHMTHQDKDVNMTTNTVNGKVLFCALKELPKEGFNEADLMEVLKDRGWNIAHNTLAPSLGNLVKEGYLVRIEGTKPSRYRLPTKLNYNIEN